MKLRVRKPEAVSQPTPQVQYPIGDELPNSCPQISQMNADGENHGDEPLLVRLADLARSSVDTIPDCLGVFREIKNRTAIAAYGHRTGTPEATGVEHLGHE